MGSLRKIPAGACTPRKWGTGMTIATLIFFISLSHAEDPKSKQIVSGIAYGAGAILTGKNAVAKSIECADENYWACLEAAGSTASTYLTAIKSDDSFDNADQLDSRGSVGRPTEIDTSGGITYTVDNGGAIVIPTGGGLNIPSGGNFSCPSDDSECNSAFQSLRTALGTDMSSSGVFVDNDTVDLGQLRDKVKETNSFAQAQLDGLKSKGINLDDIKTHPEKYLTKEQVAELKANPGKYGMDAGDISNDASSPAIAEAKDSKTNSSNMTFEIRGLASDRLFPSGSFEMPDFGNMEMFAGLFDYSVQEGLKNSAPGYYGNVSLKSLDPKSKMSLFERVSLRLKKVM